MEMARFSAAAIMALFGALASIGCVADMRGTADDQDERVGVVSQALTTYYYSRSNAVTYALTWCDGRNPSYTSFEADCTNFVPLSGA